MKGAAKHHRQHRHEDWQSCRESHAQKQQRQQIGNVGGSIELGTNLEIV